MAKDIKSNLTKKQEFNSFVKKYDKLINWDNIFPRGGEKYGKNNRPDLRKNPTRHQLKKLKQLEILTNEAGGIKRFHKMRRSKKRDTIKEALGTDEIFNGYFSQGEIRLTKDWVVLEIKNAKVELYYKGFKTPPLTADQAEEFTKELLKSRPHVDILSVGLSNKGGQFDMVGIEEDYRLPDNARMLFEKYSIMADAGEKRKNYYNQLAVHPREWLTGIAFTRLL